MLNIPEEVRELLTKGSVKKNFRVHFPNGERADITNANVISESVTLTESLCSQNSLVFGLCESPQIEFETFGVGNIRGNTIECSMEVDVTDALYRKQTIVSNGNGSQEFLVNLTDAVVGSTINLRCERRASFSVDAKIVSGGYVDFLFSEDNYTFSTTVTENTPRGLATLVLDTNEYSIWSFEVCISDLEYETSSDVDFPFYSIPYGTFVVDSCKKQADMTHRQVVAYSEYANKPLSDYPYIMSACGSNLYTDTPNAWLGLDTIVNILTANTNNMVAWDVMGVSSGTITPSYNFTYEGTDYILEYSRDTYVPIFENETLDPGTYIADKCFNTEAHMIKFQKDYELYEQIEANPILLYAYNKMVDEGLIDVVNFYSNSIVMLSGTAYYSDFKSAKPKNITEFVSPIIVPYQGIISPTILADYDFRVKLYDSSVVVLKGMRLYTSDYTEVVRTKVSTSNIPFGKNLGEFFTQMGSTPLVGNYVIPKSTSKSVKLKNTSTSKNKTFSLYKYDLSNILNASSSELLTGACEINGKFGKICRDNSFEIISIKDNFDEDNVMVISTDNYSSLWYEDEMSKPIGRVECNFDDDGETKYLKYDLVDNFNPIDYCTYSITENFFIKNFVQDNRCLNYMLSNMAQNIGDITYMPMELSMVGRPDVEAGDVFKVYLKNGTYFIGLVEQRTLSGINALSDSVTSKDEGSSTRSGSSGSSSGSVSNSLGLMAKKLWENPSPSSTFAAQTITLSDDVNNYDFIGIISAQGSGSTGRTRLLPMILWPVGSTTIAYMNVGTYRNYVREFTFSDNTISVAGCSYFGTYGSSTTTPDNASLIPRYIYGFKQ